MSNFTEKFKDVLDFIDNSDLNSPNKPVKPHVKRVGKFLFEKGFNDEVVLGGLLHDMLEWSSITEKELEEKFGLRILELIKANSKNRELFDKDINASRNDTLRRCLLVGDDAMAIKIADVLDSYHYHLGLNNERKFMRLRIYADLLRENLSENLKSIFLEDLEKIVR